MKKEPEVQPPTTEFNPVLEHQRLLKWIPKIDATTAQRLVDYEVEVLKFNKSLGLFSANSIPNLGSHHISDVALAARIVFPNLIPNEPLYDFGSGNGCVGLVFAILYPQLPVVLVDRDMRKMDFCKMVARAIGLTNVTIQVKGVEELPEYSVKNAVARDFAVFSKSLLIPRKQMRKGSKFFHIKSDGWANELASLPSQMFSHWSPNLLGKYKLPETSTEMFVVLTDKTSD